MHCIQLLQLSSCRPADFGSSTSVRLTQHVQVEKETFQQPTSHKEKHNTSIPCTDKISGSAFLMQVTFMLI